MSIIEWETVGAQISNSINMPIVVGNLVADLENIDVITPNRLRLGRNNERSPMGPLVVTGKPDRFIRIIRAYLIAGLKTGSSRVYRC